MLSMVPFLLNPSFRLRRREEKTWRVAITSSAEVQTAGQPTYTGSWQAMNRGLARRQGSTEMKVRGLPNCLPPLIATSMGQAISLEVMRHGFWTNSKQG